MVEKTKYLSSAESELINKHRELMQIQKKADAFYRVSVILAAEWQEYARIEGYHLTHSVFVENFDVCSRLERLNREHNLDGRLDDIQPNFFTEAVKKILDPSSSFTNEIYGLN